MAERWREMDYWLRAKGIRVGTATLGQTTGGTHATRSYHYLGQARDYGLYNCDCNAIAKAFLPLAKGPNHVIAELIWTPTPGPGVYMKNGYAYTPTLQLANGHRDHVHAAITATGVLPTPLPLPGDDVTPQDIEAIATAVYARLGPNAPGFDLGDTVNTIIAQVNTHVDAKVNEVFLRLVAEMDKRH
jgi:hypothetical protein